MKKRPSDWGSPPRVPGAMLAYVEERARLQAADDAAAARGRSLEDVAAKVDRLVAEQQRARSLQEEAARDLAERQRISRNLGIPLEDVV